MVLGLEGLEGGYFARLGVDLIMCWVDMCCWVDLTFSPHYESLRVMGVLV